MANFYTDNRDLVFTLKNLDLEEAVTMKEENFRFAKEFENAPVDYADACDNYDRVLKVVGEICAERIAPRSRQVDEEGPHFENGVVTYHPLTVQNLKDLTQADVMGVVLPHRYGGLNFPATIYTAITEMVSRADASLQNLVGLQDIAETICEFGSEEQRQAYLPRFAKGEIDGSMDLTEPDSGSDLQSVRLRAYQDKDGNWFLNGMKRFITNGCAKCHLVLARSEEGTTDGRGLSMFIAEACPQLVVRRIEHKLGIHGVATAELQYNDVPAQLCGQRRRGLTRYVMSLMNGARVAISAQALGIAEAAYFEAKKYASEREQFKKSIDNFPAIYDMLSSMKMKILASRALLYETTRAVDLRNAYNALVEKGENVTDEIRAKQKYYNKVAAVLTPMCKAQATEVANSVAYDTIQIHGGTGYMKDFNAERFYRDARITNIYEGTTQLQIVAAIGGVQQRDNDPRIKELIALVPPAELAEIKASVVKMYEKHLKEVEFVNGLHDPEYRDLVARVLVENETYVFVSLLMLRDAAKNDDRVVLAKRYILDAIPEFEKRYIRIMSGEHSVVADHSAVINY